MNQNSVTDLLARSARLAQEATQDRPVVNAGIVESLAIGQRLVSVRSGRRLIAAVATAAAVAIIAVSATLISGRVSSSEPIPEYVIALVDSLYPETDYVVDQISPYLSGGDDFLDSVWDQVIDRRTD